MTVSRFLRICRQRLRSLIRKEALDDQLDRELSFHFEQLVEENLAAGMNPEDARREARLAIGNISVFKEECRDQRRVAWAHDFLQDLRYGLRMMRKHPGVTSIAAISLALGIGANTAILSVGSSLLLGTLPLPDSERLVIVNTIQDRNPRQRRLASIPDYVALSESSGTFESIGASIANQQNLGADEFGNPPERLFGQAVTPSLFEALKVQPLLGRVFLHDEAQIGRAAPVIILSHRLWQRRFGGDPAIAGKQIRLNGQTTTILGVMPPGFWYPRDDSEYWVPLAFNPTQLEGSARLFMITARLKAETTIEQAQADVKRIAAQLAGEYPDGHQGWSALVVPLRESWFGWARRPLLMLEGAVVLVLLIACANVSILLLGRLPARREEVSLRVMMGAGRGRIVRQFLTESMLLSLIGGALGLAVAYWGANSLEGVNPPPGGIPIAGIGQRSGIFGFAALLSVLSSLLFGSLPALASLSSGAEARQVSVRATRRNPSGTLVSVQIGLALMLLISSGLLLNSFIRLVYDDRGFDPNGVLTFEYRIPVGDYVRPMHSYHGLPAMDATPPTQATQRLYERLKVLPGVESVAASSAPPVGGLVQPMAVIHVEGRPLPTSASARDELTSVYFLVTENFFATLRTPILRGRGFEPQDTAAASWVAVINETMARRLWPGQDPLGKHFTVDAISGERPRKVVGIVRDVPLRYIRDGARPQSVAYTLYVQQPERFQGLSSGMFGQMTFFVRSSIDPATLEATARRAAAEVDPNRPLAAFQTLTDFVSEGMRTKGYYTFVVGVFAFMATVLAAIGVYGVMSFSVSQRTREIGIRMAMGATARDIVKMVAGKALRLVAIGLLFGILGSMALTRLIAFQLWGVTPTDPATYIGVTALLLGVSMTACFIPARRATRVDPTAAIRTE